MRLLLSEEDSEKIEIRYIGGELVNLNEDILPNNTTIYIKAKVDEFGEISSNATLTVQALGTSNTINPVSTDIQMNLRKGANELVLINPSNASPSLVIKQNQDAIISFEGSPIGATLGEISFYSTNSGIISYAKLNETQFIIRGLKSGKTNVILVSSNGISKTIAVEVYVPLEDITLNIDSPSSNPSVGERSKVSTLASNPLYENNQTLSTVALSIGTGLPLQVVKYPNNSNIVSYTYSSSNINVATISTSGYIIAKGLGTSTIQVNTEYFYDLGNGQVETRVLTRSFTLTVYMPITSTQLNHYQYTLFDANTLGYYEAYKSELQLALNITPANATFNSSSIVWSVNSPYATVTENGKVKVSLPAEINSANVTVTATIQEYSRYYTQKSVIMVQKPVKVSGISVLNTQDRLYFDARNGLGEENALSAGFILETKTYPANASNNTLIYRYIADTTNDLQLGLSQEELAQPVVIVKSNGQIIPNRVGSAIIHIISQDSYTSANNYTKYVELKVRVADGQNEARAIEISSAQDLMNINTVEGLSLYYVLSNTIDLTGVAITPIGIIDGLNYGFSGNISGDYSQFGYDIEHQIVGANFNVSNTTRENYIGLFSTLNGGTIKNLTFKVNVLSAYLSNNSTGTISYVAPLVAKLNSGTIDNVKVQILSSTIELSNRNNYVGGITGYVSSTANITNSKVWGNLNVKQRIGIVAPIIYVGGVSGYNAGTIGGNFSVYDDTLIDNFGNFNSNVSLSLTNDLNTQNAVGGIAGYNMGTIENIITDSNISAKVNVGGAVGYNTGLLQEVLSSGSVKGTEKVGGLIGYDSGIIIRSLVLIFDKFSLTEEVVPQILGNNYVGGFIGESYESTISYSYVHSFYSRAIDKVLYFGDLLIDIPSGQTNTIYVGGFIGHMNSSQLNSVYSELNVSVIDDNLTNVNVISGALVGLNVGNSTIQNSYTKGNYQIEGNSTLGGILGDVTGIGSSIYNVYVTTSLLGDTVNAIIGSVNGDITVQNAYYLNTLTDSYGTSTSEVELQTQNTYIGFNFTTTWNILSEYNAGTPFLRYSSEDNMLIIVPTDIDLTVNEGISSKTEIANNHFKIDDKKAVVYYYANGGERNLYSLDNETGIYGSPIIEKQFTPTSVSVKLLSFVSSDSSIIRINEDGVIEVLKTGVVTITAYSILDKNVYDAFEIAVIAPITDFNLYKENENTQELEELSLSTTLVVKKENLIRIYPTLLAVMDDITYAYNPYTYFYYQTNDPVGVSFEGHDWILNGALRTVEIPVNNAHVLKGDYARDEFNQIITSNIQITPVVDVEFESGTQTLLFDFLQKEFNIKVIEGSTELTILSSEVNISLKDIFTIDLTLQTDIPSDTYEPYTSVTNIESIERVEIVNGVETLKEVINDELLIEKTNLSTLGNTIVDRYTLQVGDKYNDLYKVEQKYIITFASYDRSEGGLPLEGESPALTRQLILNIIPQDVIRIDSSFYASNEIFENEEGIFYNPNELPVDYIMAGRIGLLKLAIYPDFSNADYIDLTYSSNATNTMSLEQVAYVEAEDFIDDNGNNVYDFGEVYTDENNNGIYDNEGYTAVYPQSELIANGVRLRLLSNRTNEPPINGIYSYDYDGNLYVRVLIGSEVGSDVTFNLNATAYYVNENNQTVSMLSKQIGLNVQPASQLTVFYEGNTEKGYVPIGSPKEIKVAVSKLTVANASEIKFLVKDSAGTVVLDTAKGTNLGILALQYKSSQVNGYITDYLFNLSFNYSESFDFTKTYTIEAIITRKINNNTQQYKSREFLLIPVLFTIDSIFVENVDLTTNYYTVAFGGIYTLNVKLNATYNPSAESIVSNYISILEAQFSSLINAGNNTSTWYERKYNIEGATDEMLEPNDYNNYSIIEDLGEIKIKPKRVATGDIIVAKVFFSYGLDGSVKIPKMEAEDLSNITVENNVSNNILLEHEFTTKFYLRSLEENPLPIYDVEGFLDMQEGGHYILMNDITLGDETLGQDAWEPFTTVISSLDGNSKTITIKKFKTNVASDPSIPISKNFGLFDSLTENMTLKNLTVKLPAVEIDATLYEEVYFGGLAAKNNGGLIYNSYVYSGVEAGETGVKVILSALINGKSTVAHIGGIVGFNSGYIVNSRSELRIEANKGHIGGVVSINRGKITGTYYKNGYIKSTSLTSLNSTIGGFVVFNDSTGIISSSYVEGNKNLMESGNTGRILGGGLEFSGDLAGFVYENQGTIKDSYSNIKITSQSRSAGFVFINRGIIKNTFSMSKVAYNVAAHTPFIGTNNQGETQDSGDISNSYYLKGNFANTLNQKTTEILLTNWSNKSYFKGFSFSKDSNSIYGIWEMTTEGVISPTLVSANHIAYSYREIVGQTTNQTSQEVEYIYEYLNPLGTYENPLTIQNYTQFNNILTEQGNLFNQYVRIIRDFNFDEGTISESSNVEFAGILDGNDMSIGNINIVSTTTTSGESTSDNDPIGLFKKIIKNGSNIGLIKNITLKFNEVFANGKTYVGGLAGIIDNGRVYNLTIDNQQTVVQGKHLVGGVAGKVVNGSHLINISVSTSVNATYRQTVTTNVAYDIYNQANDDLISYAGAVAGVIDVGINGYIENISVLGNSSIIAETVGGAIGLIASGTTVNNALVEVVSGQFIRTTKVSGGIVGENRGVLQNAVIRHTDEIQEQIDNKIKLKEFGKDIIGQNTVFFAGIGRSAGGIVGFNNGGSINNAVAKIDVRNTSIEVVGGLVGRATGGTITNSYAYGSVLAQGSGAAGGLIGASTKKDYLSISGNDAISVIKWIYENQISNENLEINNLFAYNNWLNMDYEILVNGYLGDRVVIGGVIGVVQSDVTPTLTETKNNIIYINSIYQQTSYSSGSNWHYISEYGQMRQDLGISYSESNQLSNLSGDTNKIIREGEISELIISYPEVNNATETQEGYNEYINILANGIKIFEILNFYPY